MPTLPRTSRQDPNSLSPLIGQILHQLYGATDKEGKPESVSLSKLVDSLANTEKEEREFVCRSIIALLNTMAIISINNDGGVKATSRPARFLLGSLSKFCQATAIPEIDTRRVSEPVFRDLTEMYERARRNSSPDTEVDKEPLHKRRILNLIIKRRRTRNWREQDEYLFVYHDRWKAYHLIGLGQKHGETEEELIAKTMRQRLQLTENDYEVEQTIRPEIFSLTEFSQTNGALTEYSYVVRYVKEIKTTLHLDRLSRQGVGRYRWFTLNEIKMKEGIRGEKILFSTDKVLEHLGRYVKGGIKELEPTKVWVEDIPEPSLIERLGSFFTVKQVSIIVLVILVVALIQTLVLLFPQLTQSIPILENLANLVTFIAAIPVLAAFIYNVFHKMLYKKG